MCADVRANGHQNASGAHCAGDALADRLPLVVPLRAGAMPAFGGDVDRPQLRWYVHLEVPKVGGGASVERRQAVRTRTGRRVAALGSLVGVLLLLAGPWQRRRKPPQGTST